MKKTILAILIIVAVGAFTAEAKSLFKRKHYPPHFEYRIKAGFNIGGTTPLPLPREIRAVESYSPSLALSIGADVVRHINHKWAIMSGLTFETKGMRTWAKVKNYHIDMVISDGDAKGEINGMFTGRVKTKVKNDYLTLPLAAVYKVSPRWELNSGLFFSYLFNSNFTGAARDGYIREGSPIGDYIGVTSATYDFSSDIRNFNWGGQFGARWRAYRHFSVYGDLTWSANSIFKKKFTSISFEMYNIYLNLGFAYTF